jgi:hypothetical protein
LLDIQQKKAILGIVKTFAKEQSWWDDKSYLEEMDRRFAELESGNVKGITLEDLRVEARHAYKTRKPKKA